MPRGRNVKLVDGAALHGLIRQARASIGASPAAVQDLADSAPVREAVGVAAQQCPICAKPMVKRTAKRGANAGGAFWGCVAYPSCRGTRPVD